MTQKPHGNIRPYDWTINVVRRTCDVAWIAVAHFAAMFLYSQQWGMEHTLATVVAAALFFMVGDASHLHGPSWRTPSLRAEISKVCGTWLVVFLALVFLAFVTKVSTGYSRVVSVTWLLLAPTLISLWRVTVRQCLRFLRAQGRNTRSVALVGATSIGARLAQRIFDRPELGLRLRGYYDDREVERLEAMPSWLGGIKGNSDDLVAAARRGEVDVVYITLPLKAESRISALVSELADTTASVYVAADFFVFDLLHAQWSDVEGMPVVSIFETPFFGVNGWLKRIEDLVLGALIMAIIALPMALIALGVKLSSPGPVFFRQRRYGLNGQEIRVLKFRTMTVCEDGDQVVQAKADDQRVTAFGRFLRRTSLDELPQFLEVITGEMSIVGPRPHAVAHNEEYRRIIHGYMLRHKVKPGITGWAQVNGLRGETDTIDKMEQRVEHDLEYIRRWSLGLDLRIILRTFSTVVSMRNAH